MSRSRTRTESFTKTETHTIYYETIKDYSFVGYQVRVWREVEPDKFSGISDDNYFTLDSDVKSIVGAAEAGTGEKGFKIRDVAMAILELDNVNAVEVKGFGLARPGGVVLYKDWP